MTKKITLILFLLLVLIFSFNKVEAQTTKNLVNIYFFHSDTCSHCKEEIDLLETLKERYDNIKIYKFEVHDKNTSEVLKKANELYNLKTNGVPLTIIGNEVYMGFSYEKSSLKFIKTIEYYSKYGYNDELGKYLKIELPNYNINKKDPSLDEFINNYHNYSLLGLKTDNIDTSIISTILGLLSSFSIVSLINIIIATIIIYNKKEVKNRLIFTILFLIIKILLELTNIINNFTFIISIYILILILFLIGIIQILKNKKNFLDLNIIIVITVVFNYIASLKDKNISIFINILKLHNLEGISKLSYYSNYIIINLIMNAILLYIVTILIKQIKILFNTNKNI